MSHAIVSIQKVDHYDPERLAAAVAKHFEALGVEADIRPGMKLLIKPNLLTGRKPELAVTTHPALIRAVADWFRARGVTDVTLADSPGGPFKPQMLTNIYKACELTALEPDVKLNLDTESVEVPAAPGSSREKFTLIRPVVQADYIVNIAKMKTHGMTIASLGNKNLFGCVPGLLKPRLHYENPSLDGFSNMLVSLAETVAPALTLIDAIDCMEGNGPGGGTVKRYGYVLAARNLFAQDYVAAGLMGIEPHRVAMIKIAGERGLYNPDEIQLVGDPAVPADPPFALPDTQHRVDFTHRLPRLLRDPISALLDAFARPMPVVVPSRCVGCAKCAESCPQQIIEIVDRKAVIDRRRCISCFCCQEMCPAKAINAEQKFRLRLPRRSS